MKRWYLLGAMACWLIGCSGGDEGLTCGDGTKESGGKCVPVAELDAGVDASGGAGGAAGVAGAGGAAGAVSAIPCERSGNCPSVEMVMVTWPSDRPAFEIDAHETTGAEYDVFLKDVDAGVVSVLTEGICLEKTDHERGAECLESRFVVNEPNWPVVCVDWCDAKAYCAWAGKRLCKYDEESADGEWTRACSNSGDGNLAVHLPTEQCELPNECEDAPGLYNMVWGLPEWLDGCLTEETGEILCPSAGFLAPTCVFTGSYPTPEAQRVTIRCCR